MVYLGKYLWAEEGGQGMTEYALIITLIAMALVTSLILYRDRLNNLFDGIIGQVHS